MDPNDTNQPDEPTLDINEAVADIAGALKMTGADDGGSGQPPAEGTPPAEGEELPAPAPEGASAAPGDSPAAPTGEPAAPSPADAPPDTWTKEAKALWDKVEPGVRAEIRRREADIAKYVGQAQEAIKGYQGKASVADNLEKVLQPYAGVYQQYGINPWQHIQSLLHAHSTLVFGPPETKVAMLRQLAADVGIDLANLPAAGTAAQNAPWFSKIQSLEQEIARLRGGVDQTATAIREQRTGELEQSILAFMQDTEHNPYFAEVQEQIAPLIESGRARSLKEAYDLAVWENPTTKAKLLSASAAAQAKADSEAAAAKAAAARKALGANVKSRSAGRGAPAAETIDDTLRAAMADIRSRPH